MRTRSLLALAALVAVVAMPLAPSAHTTVHIATGSGGGIRLDTATDVPGAFGYAEVDGYRVALTCVVVEWLGVGRHRLSAGGVAGGVIRYRLVVEDSAAGTDRAAYESGGALTGPACGAGDLSPQPAGTGFAILP